MTETFLIVGANLAGGTAAANLRQEGFDGKLILLGEEPDPPYERPPLSKEYLRGEKPFEQVLVRPPDFYSTNGIETRFGERATRVDPKERSVELEDGERIPYDKVLIATGSRNRRLPIPGLKLEGVHDLRTVADAGRIQAEIAPGRKAVVVGMGFIGCEVTASFRQLGVEVSAVEFFKFPLFRVLGEQIGRIYEGIHRDHGVEMFFEDTVAAFEGHHRVERVVTNGGRVIECDFAVVGVGVEPVTDIVADSGVEIDNGVLVDEHCRTNVPGIYAAGDVTNHYHPVFKQRMRVEHWQNAIQQGVAAARNMIGKDVPYDEIHWFWSDQYEYNLQYAGYLTEWDEIAVRGNIKDRNFVVFYLKEGRLLATVGLNHRREVRQSMRLIKAGMPMDAAKLKDEEVDLRSLMSR